MSEPTKLAQPRKQPPRRATSQLFRRPSLDQVEFGLPLPKTPVRTHDGIQRPAPPSSELHHVSSLFQIPEVPADAGISKRSEPELLTHPKTSSDSAARTARPGSPYGQLTMRPSVDSVPVRISSLSRASRPVEVQGGNDTAIIGARPPPLPPPMGSGSTIPNRGGALSPVRATSEQQVRPPQGGRHTPLRTFQRNVVPMDIVEIPELRQAGFSMALKLASPVFTGGGSVEGNISIIIENGKPWPRPTLIWGTPIIPTLSLSRLTVDVLGVESCRGRNHVFRSLAMELIDDMHPPPSCMLAIPHTHRGPNWIMAPSSAKIPFCVSLPVHMGPSPYKTKMAKIQYMISVSASIKIGNRACCVRTSRGVDILTVQDPETALVNMPRPLVASDSIQFIRKNTFQELRLIAGVHRQTWVSGSPLYANVYISNKTAKHVKKIDISLEKVTSFYNHSSATTGSPTTEQLSMPEKTYREVVARQVTKADTRFVRHGWMGTSPQSQDESTCTLVVPTGLVTVDAGHFFSVRYFLCVEISIPSKRLSVQTPLVLLHPNSLDIVPNALAQVSRAIENARRSNVGERPSTAENACEASVCQPVMIEHKNSQGNTRINQATPYNVARRISLDQVGFDSRYREVAPLLPRPSVSTIPEEHPRRVTFEPLQLNLPEPPKNGSILDFTYPIVPARLKAHTPSKSSAELGLGSRDIRALTRDLNDSPRFKARRSEDDTKEQKSHESIMMRQRPRAWSEAGHNNMLEADVSHISLKPVTNWIRDGHSSSESDGNISGWDGFRASRAFDYKLNEPGWANTHENTKAFGRANPCQETDWEDVDSLAADGLGGGPGPDVGHSACNRKQSSSRSRRRVRPLSGSVRLRSGRIMSRSPSSSGRVALSRTLASPKNSLLGQTKARHHGAENDHTQPPQAPTPKYHIRRTIGNTRANPVQTHNKYISSSPFFHGSSRLVHSNSYARMRAASAAAVQNVNHSANYDTDTFNGRDRSASEGVQWENRRMFIVDYGRDGARDSISTRYEPHKSESTGKVTKRGRRINSRRDNHREAFDLASIPQRKASTATRPPPSAKCRPVAVQGTLSSNSSSSSCDPSLQISQAAQYETQIQEWHGYRKRPDDAVQTHHLGRSPSPELTRKPSSDHPQLAIPLRSFSESSPIAQRPPWNVTQLGRISRPNLGTYSSPRVPTLGLPADHHDGPSVHNILPHQPLPFTSVSTSQMTSPPNSTNSHEPTLPAQQPHQDSNLHQPNNLYRPQSSLSNPAPPPSGPWQPPTHFKPHSRPPPTHPNSNILSPIAELTSGRTRARRRGGAGLGPGRESRRIPGLLRPHLRHVQSNISPERSYSFGSDSDSHLSLSDFPRPPSGHPITNSNREISGIRVTSPSSSSNLVPAPLAHSALMTSAETQSSAREESQASSRRPPSPFVVSPEVNRAGIGGGSNARNRVSELSMISTHSAELSFNGCGGGVEQKRFGRVELGRFAGRRPGERRVSVESGFRRGSRVSELSGGIGGGGEGNGYGMSGGHGMSGGYRDESIEERRRAERVKRRRMEWLQGLELERGGQIDH